MEGAVCRKDAVDSEMRAGVAGSCSAIKIHTAPCADGAGASELGDDEELSDVIESDIDEEPR